MRNAADSNLDIATLLSSGELLTPEELGQRLKRTAQTLERWRRAGCGPTFVPLEGGGILYHWPTVCAWLASRQCSNSAEAYELTKDEPSVVPVVQEPGRLGRKPKGR